MRASVADTGAGMTAEVAARVFDLIVSDVGMPGGMNGRQLADAARRLQPGVPVLFTTGYAANAVLGNEQLPAGMQVLTTPYALSELLERVQQALVR